MITHAQLGWIFFSKKSIFLEILHTYIHSIEKRTYIMKLRMCYFHHLVCVILVSFFYWAQIPVKKLDIWKYTKPGQERQAFSYIYHFKKQAQLVGRIVRKLKKALRHWSLNHKKWMYVQLGTSITGKMCQNLKANLLLSY